MRCVMSCAFSGFVIFAVSIQLGFEPPKSLAWLGQPSSFFIWILLGGLVGLLLGLLVQGIGWTIRTLSGNWTRLGR